MAAPGTVLLELDAVRIVLLVLVRVVVATLALLASERDELTHVVILSERSTQGYQGSAGRVNAGPDGPCGANVTAPVTAAQYSRPRRAGKTRRVAARPGAMLARVTAPPEEVRVLGAAADDLVRDPRALLGVAGDLDEIRCPGTFGATQKTRA